MGLFESKGVNASIHAIRLKIRGDEQPLPAPLVGAYVTAFTIAAEPQEAVTKSVRGIRAMGYDFEDVMSEGLSLPASEWSTYVAQAWPEFVDHFPSQSEIAARLAGDGVVFSPFAGFETS